MSASILMYTTCLGLQLTSYSGSHCRDIPVLFWGCVYTTTDWPALLLCVSTVDSGGLSRVVCVLLKNNEKRADKRPQRSSKRSMSVSGIKILTGQVKLQLEISVSMFQAQSWEERPASGSSHLDAKILPLNPARTHVNAMISLCLPLK